MKAMLVDIDHTLSDAAWRDHLIPVVDGGGRVGWEAWKAYYEAGDRDEPNHDVIDLVRIVYASHLWWVVGLSARPEKTRQLTMAWLKRHNVPMDELLLRPDDDHRPSPVVKIEQVKKRFAALRSEIAMVLDDREDIVQAFCAEGLTVLKVHAVSGARRSAIIRGEMMRQVLSE